MSPMSEHNYKEVWQYAMKELHEQYKKNGQETEFLLWFKMDYVEDTISTITVAVASDFLWHTMVKKGNIDIITKKICELTGQNDIQLKCIIKNSSVKDTDEKEDVSAENKTQKNDTIKSASVHEKQQTAETAENRSIKKHPQLQENYTFDTFVPGENNNYAYNAALAVAKNPGNAYNPILLYGGVGIGKTHLMESIGNYIWQQKGEKAKICYISAEAFTNEFTISLRDKTETRFKSKYRNLDVLLLDDIHFLQGKTGIQEELFYTFNALRDKKSQMVFTCDRPISELKGFTERMSSRIGNGLCIDMQPPNYETRYAILLKKLELMGKTIPGDVIDYIAKNVVTNVRDLESALTKMIGYSELINKTLTVEIAQQQLRDTFSTPLSGVITIDTIQKVVADHYSISVADIKSKKRDRKFVIPRQIALYIARQLTEYSFPELGEEFGGRDHTTAMHSFEKIENQLKTDSSLNSLVRLLMKNVKDFKK